MTTTNFQFSFNTLKQPNEIFSQLLDPNSWWVGLFDETIQGQSKTIGDEFTFSAGGGMHHTTQQLIELVPNKKIAWAVIDSKLTFLKDQNEWDGTTICFEIEQTNNLTTVTFSHKGLTPEIECYDQCSSAWTMYLQNLAAKYGEGLANN
ncbi:MAG: SRPBCC domain-containing protein [Bacteroidota bacterium]